MSPRRSCSCATLVELQPPSGRQQRLIVEAEAVADARRLPGDIHALAYLRRLAVFLRSLEVIAALQRQLGLQQVGRSLAARLLLVIGEGNGAK
jgi:hypothetical protein